MSNNQKIECPQPDDVFAEFAQWLEAEKEKGLVDIKFAVQSRPDDSSSVREVLKELLRAEKMIAAGITEPHQEPSFFQSGQLT